MGPDGTVVFYYFFNKELSLYALYYLILCRSPLDVFYLIPYVKELSSVLQSA